jgi:hypothetical protein
MPEAASVGLGWWSDEPSKAVHGETGKLPIVSGAARPTPSSRMGVRSWSARATMPWD